MERRVSCSFCFPRRVAIFLLVINSLLNILSDFRFIFYFHENGGEYQRIRYILLYGFYVLQIMTFYVLVRLLSNLKNDTLKTRYYLINAVGLQGVIYVVSSIFQIANVIVIETKYFDIKERNDELIIFGVNAMFYCFLSYVWRKDMKRYYLLALCAKKKK